MRRMGTHQAGHFAPPPLVPKEHPMVPDILTLPELADMARISVRHARRLVRDGGLPAPIRLGRCQRWSRQQIEAWLSSATRPGLVSEEVRHEK